MVKHSRHNYLKIKSEEYTEDEWKTICKLFGVDYLQTSRIDVYADLIDYTIQHPPKLARRKTILETTGKFDELNIFYDYPRIANKSSYATEGWSHMCKQYGFDPDKTDTLVFSNTVYANVHNDKE